MNYWMIGGIAGAGLLLWIIGCISQMQSDLARINKNLYQIAKQVGVPDIATEEVKKLVQQGKKVEAIKRYSDATGLGLKESKEYVDSL